MNITRTGIITIHRGDTFSIEVSTNVGSTSNPSYPTFKLGDKIYLGVMESNQDFENAIIKKVLVFTTDFSADSKTVTFSFTPTDTEYLLAGNYYYEVKEMLPLSSSSVYESGDVALTESGVVTDGNSEIFTILPKTKFIIMD